MPKEASQRRSKLYHCSFCGKSSKRVDAIIKRRKACICDECVKDAQILLQKEGFWNDSEDQTMKLFNKLGIKPIFPKIRTLKTIDNYCFYLCPFGEPFDTIYNDFVIETLNKYGYIVKRADEIVGTQAIVSDVWENINLASMIIADVTDKNPNVMYEIGMAHTVGKSVVILTQNISDIPFDLKHLRCIDYTYTPMGCKTLVEKLSSTLEALKELQ